MPDKSAPDRLVAEIAGRQHGAISIQQLQEAGLSRDAVLERRRAGRLHSLHRGVYAVGHTAPSIERRWMAAVLALGGNAVLSHRSAAALWGLLPAADSPVDLSLPSRSGRRRRQGIRVHRPVSSDGTRSELERRFLSLCSRHRLPKPAVNMRVDALTVDFCWVEQRLIVETDGYRYHRGGAAFEDDRARDLKLRALGYEVMRLSYRQVFEAPGQVADVLRAVLMPAIGAR